MIATACSVRGDRALGGASMKLARLASASLLALTLWFMGEPALAQQEQALIAGIGRMSCAYWRSESINEGAAWILGFWSGLNHANARTVGQHTNSEGINAEVRKGCAAGTSMNLAGYSFSAAIEKVRKEQSE